MATRVKRVSDFAKHGMNYLFKRDEISPLEKERNREKAWLKDYIDEQGVLDDNGNRNVYFVREGSTRFVPGPGNTEYWGLQQRRAPGATYMDSDEVKKFMDKHFGELEQTSTFERVVYTKTVEVVDVDELYKLMYEKVITEKQLRALERHYPDTYQLWPITEAPLEVDDE